MKTLAQLGLAKHKTGNYADYFDKKDCSVVCCGLMDVHEDSDNLVDSGNPIFKVEPLYWDEDVVFVYQPRSRWHSLTREDFLSKKKVSGIKFSGDAFYFDSRKYHGLVPKGVADKLNDKDYLKSEEYLTFVEFCNKMMAPKLVWKWNK